MELDKIAQRISEKFAKNGHQIDQGKITDRLNRFVLEFGIPEEEAERSIISEYMREFGITQVSDQTDTKTSDSDVNLIADTRSGDWVTLEGVVTVLFESRSPAVAQSGIFADRSGTMRFTIWSKAHAPVLEKGKWYRIESAVVDEYNGQLSFKVHSGTTIKPMVEEEIPPPTPIAISDLPKGVVTFEGKVVSLTERQEGPIKVSGIAADATGAIRFTIRQGDPSSGIETGNWYRFENAIADIFRGAMNIQFNAGTSIHPITDDRSLRPAIIPVNEIKPGIVCIRVKFVQEYESSSERIFQSGILGDETGTIRFVTWNDENVERLTLGAVYTIYYVSADEFNGKPSLTLNGATCIADEAGAIEVKPSGDIVTGALVHISPGSGLIKRCPIEGCGRVLSRQNYCQVHEIQPHFHYDLRIKGWIDNGKQTWDTIISREGVEKLLSLSLAGAQEMADNNPLGMETVYYHLCEQVLGRYLTCQGRIIDNRLVTSQCSFLTLDSGKLADLINRIGVDDHE